ncbi:hypothetical protein MYU51_006789 [Penicillium brevicompactum]|uniref:uncharacterized protein n=1 Tax=Penicillium brevicompactum TaxID=5074 RepID=UPI0025407507|nr:uncharacterized protein N7506_012157 [Penicillium brevicompactum]KAJ5319453.1 hypothetical protein N7506_012157 [Penicillium brevicompactum]
MRILCLHGFGMNPDIMKRQMSTIRKICDPSWEFHFLAGNIECSPAPGAEAMPGPYLCYTSTFDPASMRAAEALVHAEFEKEGPFDGVFGFSTGASILAAYLLGQRVAQPDKPLPVQFAIFCSAVPIIASDPTYYQAIYGSLSQEEERIIRSAQYDQYLKLPEPIQSAVTVIGNVTDMLKPVLRNSRLFFLDRSPLEIPCPLNPDLYTARLNIPTLHTRATREPPAFKESSLAVESFCVPTLRRTFEHSVAHGLPKKLEEIQNMVAAMEEVIGSDRRARL